MKWQETMDDEATQRIIDAPIEKLRVGLKLEQVASRPSPGGYGFNPEG
jgi:hypothetical protein